MGAIYLEHWKRVPLVGQELDEYERQRRHEKEMEIERQKAEEEKERKKKEQTEMYDYEGEDVDSSSSLYHLWHGSDLYSSNIRSTQGKEIFPMFPCVEKRSLFDEYGEVIRPDDLISVAEKAMQEDLALNTHKGKDEEMEVEEKPQAPVIPTKCIVETLKVSIQCRIEYIDFEGRSDGRSIKKILSHVQPRKLILIHGGVEASHSLATYARNMSDGPKAVFTPTLAETLDVTEASNLFRMHLKGNFMESLKFIDIEDLNYSISYLEGIIMIPPKELGDDNKWVQAEPYLDVLPQSNQSRGHQAHFIGDVKLSNFRQVLHEAGLRAEFKGGALVVNGSVAVWKDSENSNNTTENANNFHIDGALSEDYIKVRDLLYSQFHIL
jgi:cleavage and polyadenylation specificity factor subunit 2